MKRWGFIPIVLMCAAFVLAGQIWKEDDYGGKTYSLSTTDSILVKWDRGKYSFIDTDGFTEASFTFRIYTLGGDSIFLCAYTTDFPDEGKTDSTDLTDYSEIFRDTVIATGVVQFVLGKTQATSFGKYVAIQIRGFGTGSLSMGDSYYLRGQD